MRDTEMSAREQEERSLQRHQHARFLESLERHATSSGGEQVSRAVWSRMASDLGWSVEQVQVYAYWYMMALAEDDDQAISQGEQQDNGGNNVIMNGGGHRNDNELNENLTNGNSEWTLEEDILLESLLAVYLPLGYHTSSGNNTNNNHSGLDWEEQVASRLPGKTPMQVRQRYRQLFGDRGT